MHNVAGEQICGNYMNMDHKRKKFTKRHFQLTEIEVIVNNLDENRTQVLFSQDAQVGASGLDACSA